MTSIISQIVDLYIRQKRVHLVAAAGIGLLLGCGQKPSNSSPAPEIEVSPVGPPPGEDYLPPAPNLPVPYRTVERGPKPYCSVCNNTGLKPCSCLGGCGWCMMTGHVGCDNCDRYRPRAPILPPPTIVPATPPGPTGPAGPTSPSSSYAWRTCERCQGTGFRICGACNGVGYLNFPGKPYGDRRKCESCRYGYTTCRTCGGVGRNYELGP